MKIIQVKNAVEGGQKAFELLQTAFLAGKRNFGLATGGTPETLYEVMIKSNLDFSECLSINLDEYVGLSGENEQSYRYYMNQHLFNHKPFKETYVPNGLASDLTAECARYDSIIQANPIDFQILGIGENGHIGFNEPGTSFDETTHVVALTPSTIAANQRYFASKEEVPTHALSMGIASIMQSKEIVLLAFGEKKAKAIQAMLEGEVTESLPASILQKHPHVTVIIDQKAASLLNK